MRHKRLKVSAVLLLGLGLTGLLAQETITSSGGEATGSGGSASYSVGQVAYTTNTGTNGSMAQGIQQPYEISIVNEIEEAKGIKLMVSAYPNPTIDYLILKVENYDKEKLSYRLFDINGKLLESMKITTNKTSIAMSRLLPASYFLKVIKNQKEVKMFKIIKK